MRLHGLNTEALRRIGDEVPEIEEDEPERAIEREKRRFEEENAFSQWMLLLRLLPFVTGRNAQQGDALAFEHGGDALGDQWDAWIVAKDAKTGEGLGYVDYTLWRGETHLKMIEVKPEAQGKGVGRALIQELMRENEIPYEDIQWGMTTESGTGLKEKLDSELSA